jgi:hypothetical protein
MSVRSLYRGKSNGLKGSPSHAPIYVDSDDSLLKIIPAGSGTTEEGIPTSPTTGLKIARGQHTTVDADDTVVTGLATVVAVVASLDDDPVDGVMHVTATLGDQAGSPAAGSIQIKSWKSTDADATLIAGTTFTKKVNWIAIGT